MTDAGFEFEFHGRRLRFQSPSALFSPKSVDRGTRAMLETVDFSPDDRVLDLGCGCGVVGIAAATIVGSQNVVLADVDSLAVETSKANAAQNGLTDLAICLSDGFRDLQQTEFTKILSNPPYHADYAVAKHFILKGFNRLAIGGELIFVVKRARWYQQKLRSVFGGCRSVERDGYTVLMAQRRSDSYARKR